MRIRDFVWLALAAVVSGCAGGSSRAFGGQSRVDWARLWPELARTDVAVVEGALFPVRRPDEQAFARLAEAERAWRAGDDARYEALRAELVGDPVAACWLTRLLVRETLFWLRRPETGADALVGTPKWQRPFDEIVDLGSAAAPCIVLDLLRSREADERELAADLLRAMGPSALPAWQRVFDVDDARVRRFAIHAIEGWGPEVAASTRPILEAATRDREFGVRAAAWRALGTTGPDAAPMLRAALATEEDPFVRRGIVAGLAHARDRESAEAVLAFLEQAIQESDDAGVRAAREALETMAGSDVQKARASWRAWLETLPSGR